MFFNNVPDFSEEMVGDNTFFAKVEENAKPISRKYPRCVCAQIKHVEHKTNTLEDGREEWDFGAGVKYYPDTNRIIFKGKQYTGGAGVIAELVEDK